MTEDDELLVARCLRGETTAFGQLVERYQGPVFNAAYRIVDDYAEAQDIAQTTFIKAYSNLEKFDPERPFFSWLYRIAVNEALNALRRRGRFEPVEKPAVVASPSPEQAVAASEQSQAISAALRVLEPHYRTVIVLRHFLECSYREISEILQLPEKTVKSRLFTARRLLKEILQRRGLMPEWSKEDT